MLGEAVLVRLCIDGKSLKCFFQISAISCGPYCMVMCLLFLSPHPIVFLLYIRLYYNYLLIEELFVLLYKRYNG